MPEFKQESSSFISDVSKLPQGWRPAYLCLISDEAVPEGWQMRGGRMWRWHFAVWESPQHISSVAPEHQSAPTSKTFSPGGKNPPSKAFVWTCELIGRRPNPGESVNLDPMMPIPCRVKIARTKTDGTPIEYARILEIEAWDDGAPLLTSELRDKLLAKAQEWASASEAAATPHDEMPARQTAYAQAPTSARPTW